MVRPVKSGVIILPNEKVTETESGLAVVGSYNPELGLRRGKVISTGSEVKEVEAGQEVCYMAYSGLPLKHEGVRYLVMPESEIVGIALN